MSLTLTLERGGGEVSGSGTNIELDGTIAGGAIESVEMYGDTEQTTYSGKNLFDYTKFTTINYGVNNGDGTLTSNQFTNATWSGLTANFTSIPITQEFTVSMEIRLTQGSTGILNKVNDGVTDMTPVLKPDISTQWQKYAFKKTPSAGYSISRFYVQFQSINGSFEIKNIQLELGSTATSFEPYVGGTASPNPDYPQEVQTVTGDQTITISDGQGQSQSYSVNLGDIELCKIGTYQDYIYKSGEDWYVHKETGKYTLDGSLAWYTSGSCFKLTNLNTDLGYAPMNSGYVFYPATDSMGLWCNYGIAKSGYKVFQGTEKGVGLGVGNTGGGAADGIYVTSGSLTLADFQTILNTSPLVCYYILATATETKITNSALIAQLDALNSAQTYDGTTVITVSSENLAGSLEVTASASITKTYTEVEIGSPFTITDVEGKSSNTTLDGNVYVDWAYSKKQYSFDLFNLTPQDYADIRAFYDYQFNNSAFPTITVPELNIDKLPVYMEISSRNIINQCLLTDKLTIKFRETVQP